VQCRWEAATQSEVRPTEEGRVHLEARSALIGNRSRLNLRRANRNLRLRCLLATAAAALALPASASAAAVSSDPGGNLSFLGAPGETNWAFVAHGDPQGSGTLHWVVSDSQSPLTPGTNCATYADPNTALCTTGGSANIDLGDGNDRLGELNPEGPTPLTVTALGGPGDDILVARADGGHWLLDGGDGNDQVSADRASLTDPSGMPQPVSAVPGDYQLRGGNGDDEIVGVAYDYPIAEQMDGGPGNDNLAGFNGDDQMQGGDGNDNLEGGEGNDMIDGGAGDDRIVGGFGTDTLVGGDGNDTIDAIDCGLAGAAQVPMCTQPQADTVDCGPGTDQVVADNADVVGLSCETIGDTYTSCPVTATGCTATTTLIAGSSGSGRITNRSLDAKRSGSSRRKKQLIGKGTVKIPRGHKLAPGARLSRMGRNLVKKRGTLRVSVVVKTEVKRGRHKSKFTRHRGTLTITKAA
jgi:hypothetical protein